MASQAIGPHFLDTGPVFCLGGSVLIAELYDAHLLVDARVVEAVVVEINRRAGQRTERNDPRRQGPANKAARNARHRYGALLGAAVPRPNPTPEPLADIESSMRARQDTKKPGKQSHHAAHRGESDSIHAAGESSATFVSCDGDARHEAGERGVASLTFVDVARYLHGQQHEVKERTLLSELQGLARRNIDIGEVVQSILDIRTRR